MLGMGPPLSLELSPDAFVETLQGCVEAEAGAWAGIRSRRGPDLAPLAADISRKVLELQKGFFDLGSNKADACLSLGRQDACLPLHCLVLPMPPG